MRNATKDATVRLGRRYGVKWWSLALVFGALLLAGCGASTASGTGANNTPSAPPATAPTATKPAATAKVKVIEKDEKYGFDSTMLTVAVGTTVVWTNATDAPHTVTSDTGSTLASPTIDPKGTFSFTFTQPGTYSYHCTLHPYMKATIVVTG
jgi:plastocyanin